MIQERLRVYIGPRRKRKTGGYYPKWPFRYRLPGQPWVHGTGAFTEAATRQLVDGMIQDHLLKLKMAERGIDLSAPVPVQKHIADYLKWGKHGGGKGGLPWSKEHFDHRKSQLRSWIEALRLETLADVNYDAFSAVNTERLAAGRAPNTVNHHAWALVAFVAWCRERKRIATNVLEGFTSLDRRPRRERGAFDASEFQALLAAAPPERRIVYRVAAYSGLRRSALASLRVRDVEWSSGLVTLHWRAAKSRKTVVKALPRRLLEELRLACQGRAPDALLLDFAPRQAARGIHRDMLAAGIPILKNGRRRDFHSLKASLGTFLDDVGTPPEITQKALDHASFRQTQGYIKREIGSLRHAVEELENRLTPVDIFHTNAAGIPEALISLGPEGQGVGATHSGRGGSAS